jgi:hypothetical protein
MPFTEQRRPSPVEPIPDEGHPAPAPSDDDGLSSPQLGPLPLGPDFYFGGRLRPRIGSKAWVWRYRTPTRVSCPKGDAPALFLLASSLVCSQSPLVGASGSQISLDEATAFAGISRHIGALGRHVDPRHQARPQEGVGAGEALALLYRQAESPCWQNSARWLKIGCDFQFPPLISLSHSSAFRLSSLRLRRHVPAADRNLRTLASSFGLATLPVMWARLISLPG